MRTALAIAILCSGLGGVLWAQQVATGGGPLPDGWKMHFDDPAAKPNQVLVEQKEHAVTVTAGPAAIYYKPDMKASGDYELSAVVSQIKTTVRPEGYGLCVAGNDLDKASARYTCFLVRQTGQFAIERHDGPETTAIVDWTNAPAMHEPNGMKTSNTLAIRVIGNDARFQIDNKDVRTLTRAQIGGDGITGIRVGPDLHVQVTTLTLGKM